MLPNKNTRTSSRLRCLSLCHSHAFQVVALISFSSKMESNNIILLDHNDPKLAPPSLQPAQVTQQMLSNISSCRLQQDQELDGIRHQQMQCLQHPLVNTYNMLIQQQSQLRGRILEQLQILSSLEQQFLLLPLEIDTVRQLKEHLHLQIRQLEIYQEELKQYQQTQVLQPLLALVICKQPFPMVVRKGKQFNDDLLAAQVITGAYITVPIEALPPPHQRSSSARQLLNCWRPFTGVQHSEGGFHWDSLLPSQILGRHSQICCTHKVCNVAQP